MMPQCRTYVLNVMEHTCRTSKPEMPTVLPTPASSRAKLVPPLPPSHHLQPPLPTAPKATTSHAAKPSSSQAKQSSLSQSERERQALRESYLERENQGRREGQGVQRKEHVAERSAPAAVPRLEKENELYRREERQHHQAMAPPANRPRYQAYFHTVPCNPQVILLQDLQW